MNRMLLAMVLVSALALPSTLLAQFSYAPIDVPGAVATEARGINNNGEIVGFYKTAACTDYDVKVPNCPTKGFKYVNGAYIKLMVPGSVTTAIMGVNDYGDLMGFYSKMVSGCSNPVFHGFIWYHQNVVKTIDYPGSDTCNDYNNNKVSGTTVPFGINKAGTVVGGLWGLTPNGAFPNDGWVWVNGTFSKMDPEPPNPAGPCCWSVNGISNNGIISGQTFVGDFWQAWLKEATDRDFYMDIPAGNNGADSFGTGLNSATDVVGYTGLTGWLAKNIEQNEGSNDTDAQPSFVTVSFPNSQNTIPFAVNDLRGIVGTYVDAAGKQHGFLAK